MTHWLRISAVHGLQIVQASARQHHASSVIDRIVWTYIPFALHLMQTCLLQPRDSWVRSTSWVGAL